MRHYARRNVVNGNVEIVDRNFDFIRAILPYDYRFTCNADQWDHAERICAALEGPMASQGVVTLRTKQMPIIPTVADMAHFNPVNFTQLKGAGFVGVIHKARQGIAIGDPKYAVRMAAAKDVGLRWGAYDFATHDDVAGEVTAFLKTAALESTDAAVLDFEDNAHSQMSGAQAYEWLDRVMQALGRAAIIYGGNRIREQIKPDDPKWIDMAKVVRLWQCRYIRLQPADNAELFRVIPPIPPWTANFLIQYAADGVGPQPHTAPGLQNGADLNAFAGTPDELAAQWAGQAVTFAVAGA